jgi:hypothetical protein
MIKTVALLTLLVIITSCSMKSKNAIDSFPAHYPRLLWYGRTLENNAGHRALVGSASSLKFRCFGDEATVWMQNVSTQGIPNYYTLIVDGKRYDRIAITSDTFIAITIPIVTKAETHDIEIYKETEPYCGQILISSVDAMGMGELPYLQAKHIELIGNSIMAGMGADISVSPCGQGQWCDQHNAYDAFGPRAARALNCQYAITAVSGMGMYRNWNTDGPVMKDVYESVTLSPDTTTERIVYGAYSPDVIVTCIGANDLSDGDGVTPRLPFDSTKFISAYLDFINIIHTQYPQAKWLLLNSPVNDVAKDEMFRACLDAIKKQAPAAMQGLMVETHYFDLMNPTGCDGHPDVQQHEVMAKEMEGKLNSLLK